METWQLVGRVESKLRQIKDLVHNSYSEPSVQKAALELIDRLAQEAMELTKQANEELMQGKFVVVHDAITDTEIILKLSEIGQVFVKRPVPPQLPESYGIVRTVVIGDNRDSHLIRLSDVDVIKKALGL